MSDGVWENVAPSKLCSFVDSDRDRPEQVAKRVVAAAKKTIHTNHKYRDDMTCVLIILYQYGKFISASADPTDAQIFDETSPVITGTAERVAAAIEHCEQLIDEKGVHPEDAPDAVAGLTPEERQQVIDFLKKHRGGTKASAYRTSEES